MSERVNPLDGSAAGILLMNAMSAGAKDTEFDRLFVEPSRAKGEPIKVDVVLLVNGHEVPFMKCVNDAWKSIDERVDEMVREKAMELVSKSRLDGLMRALDDAEWRIEEELRKAQELPE
jgi:ribosome-associated translation inhibitor RaiA